MKADAHRERREPGEVAIGAAGVVLGTRLFRTY